MNLIDRYIGRSILAATGMVALVVAALLLLSTFISEADHIGDGSFGLLQVLAFSLLRLPARLNLVIPVVALLGALLALGALAAGRELVVIRGAGVSMYRLALSVSVAGVVLALITLALGEYLGPAGMHAGDVLRDTARHGKRVSSIDDGLWLRQNNIIVRIDGTLPNGHIDGLDAYELNADGRLIRTLSAKRAVLRDHRLVVSQPRYTRFSTRSTETGTPDSITLDVDIDPAVLDLAATQPDELSSAGLWRYIDYLQANDIDAADYRLALWRNIVSPFTVWVLVVFALPFAFGSLRSAGAGQRLFLGGLAGLIFFLVDEIVASSGPVYGLAPWLAASLPTVLLAIATGVWMRRLN